MTYLPPINPYHLKILFFLFKFRFIHTLQFQKLFNHKDPHRVKEWLTYLTINKYIYQDFDRSKFITDHRPAVYHLLPMGRKELKKYKECDFRILERIYKDGKRKLPFINQCLFITDVYLFFLSRKERAEKLTFYTNSDLIKFDYFPDPLPTAYIALASPKSKTKRYFLEVIKDETPKFVTRIRAEQYMEYADLKKWQEHTKGKTPPIFIICPDEEIKKFLNNFIKKQITDLTFYLTTKDTILFAEKNVRIWQKVE